MSESLRWKLVLGCILIAGLEVPEVALQLFQDLGGPYRHEKVGAFKWTGEHHAASIDTAKARAHPPAILVATLEQPRRESLPFLASGARAAWECARTFPDLAPNFTRIRYMGEDSSADTNDTDDDRRAIQLVVGR